MKMLSQAVGVSHNAPSRHFSSKADLQAAIATKGFGMLADQLQPVRFDTQTPTLTRFSNMGKTYIRFGLANPDIYRLMFGRTDLIPKEHPELLNAMQTTRTELLEMIVTCQNEGVFIDGPARELGLIVWASAHGLTTLLIDNQANLSDVETMLEMATQSLLTGLKRP